MDSRKRAAIAGGLAAVLAAGAWLLWERGVFGGQGGEAGLAAGQRPPPVVETVAARRGRVEETVRAVGSIEAAERVAVTSQVTGKVAVIRFREGQAVEQGEELVVLDTERQQAALQVAEAEYRDARRQLQRLQAIGNVAVSESTIDEAKARLETAWARVAEARAVLADQRIVAPFAGVVGLREVSPGALIEPGTPITTLATLDRLKVRFALPAELLPRLEPGLTLEVTAPGFGQRFRGRVAGIDNTVDPDTRSVTVEGTLATIGGDLKPGIFVSVDTVVAVRTNAVLIPEEALVLEGGNPYVYVVGPALMAQRQSVTLGVRRPGEAEVVDGLAAGARVVTRGLQQVQAGQPVQLAEDLAQAAASGDR